MADAPWAYRHEPGSQPLGPYKITAQVRHNDLYEQYVVSLESGVRLSLKSVFPQLAPRVEPLGTLGDPFSAGLVSVLDFGRLDPSGDVLVVTELVGMTLRERLTEGGALPADQALACLRDIARALRTMEERELPMPTVSPEAVCMRQDGARLDDYFLPLLFDGQKLPPNFFLAGYSAPELDESGPGSKSTLFSLGAVFYEMLSGQPPFGGSVFQVIAAIRTLDADLSRVPEPVRPLLARMIPRDPRQRFSSLAELSTALGSETPRMGEGSWSSPGIAGSTDLPDKAQPERPRLESAGVNESGRPEFRRTLDGAIMVLIPGGTFMMGNAEGSDAEKPPVSVTLDPFLMDKRPVTWEVFVAAHSGHDKSCEFCAVRNQVLPSRFLATPMKMRDEGDRSDIERLFTALNEAVSARGGENLPVAYLTWREMRSYAESVGAELPSEAEWEYANRAGSSTRYPWGDSMDPAGAWFMGNSGGIPHPVGEKKPNGWGLHDMNGNIMEMCRDHFVKEVYEMVAAGAATPNELVEGVERPVGRHSARGGAHTSAESGITASFRVGAAQEIRSEVRGFRCVIRTKNAPEWALPAFGSVSEDR